MNLLFLTTGDPSARQGFKRKELLLSYTVFAVGFIHRFLVRYFESYGSTVLLTSI
jgi:hypothetical protein